MGYHDYLLMLVLTVELRLAALQGKYLTDWATSLAHEVMFLKSPNKIETIQSKTNKQTQGLSISLFVAIIPLKTAGDSVSG